MKRKIYFIIFYLLGLFIYFGPLKAVAALSFHHELYSHFFLIPAISGFIFVINRKNILADISYGAGLGASVAAGGLAAYGMGLFWQRGLNQNDFLFLCMLGVVAWILGGFILFYGRKAFQKGLFPLLFLAFMIPIPSVILDPLIRFLQVNSAHAVQGIFEVIGIPYYRDGMVFELSGVAIEIAKECSGIRSTLALCITTVLAGYLLLETGWRRLLLVLAAIPDTILKNAIRIVTLSLLAEYVDMSWLTNSWLHHSGGIVFFVLGLALLVPVLWVLRKTEVKKEKG